ncbi:MAG: holo-ACP synthase, partial [Candidatus Kryptoniota bacterium]
MIIRTGVDLIEIERIEAAIHRYGNRFLRRIFTQKEIEDSQNKPESLAARFAAKEAVSKALGCGIGEVGWLDIEIVSDYQHQPNLVLHNNAQKLSQALNLVTWSI